MNDDDGEEFVKSIGSSAKFWQCNVTETDEIAKAVQGAAEWAKTTNKPIGGAIAAAGISLPATVSHLVIEVSDAT